MARMPYTNFHDINLDWIIKRVMKAFTPDNPPDYPVKSVNSKTGHVVLDSDDIQDLDSGLDLTDALRKKQNSPESAGSAGQVLGLDNQLQPVWLNQSGGGGGTSNYNDLQNKPQINGNTLSGNKTGPDLGVLNSPTVAGNNGQVLTSNGDGTQSWKTIINDNADGTVTTQTWSANKITQELGTLVDGLNDKIDKPETQGTVGQVLGLDNNLDPVWVNQSGGTSVPNLELIKHDTITEEVQRIYFNTDENNNSFALDEILFVVKNIAGASNAVEGYGKVLINAPLNAYLNDASYRICDVNSVFRRAGQTASLIVYVKLHKINGIYQYTTRFVNKTDSDVIGTISNLITAGVGSQAASVTMTLPTNTISNGISSITFGTDANALMGVNSEYYLFGRRIT